MISILMFVPKYPYPIVGGLEKQAHELSKELIAQGIKVQVLSGNILLDQLGFDLVEGVPVYRIYMTDNRLIRFLTMPFRLSYTIWKMRCSFNIIHLHQHSWASLFVIIIAKIIKKPVITKLPNVGDYGLPGQRKMIFGNLKHIILMASDAIIAMSAESLKELKDAGYPREQVLMTPNGISLKSQCQKIKKPKHNNICRVVCVGRLSEEKQIHILLKAWELVCKQETHQAMLEVWGEGPLRDDLIALCVELNIVNRVTFLGYVENAAAKLSEMDIFVMPSRVEGNSNAILEAMASGLPIVSTPVGGTPMLVGEEGKYLLVPVSDYIELSKALLLLINDEKMRDAVGILMRNRVEKYFDIRVIARTYIDAYSFLAEGRNTHVSKASNFEVLGGF